MELLLTLQKCFFSGQLGLWHPLAYTYTGWLIVKLVSYGNLDKRPGWLETKNSDLMCARSWWLLAFSLSPRKCLVRVARLLNTATSKCIKPDGRFLVHICRCRALLRWTAYIFFCLIVSNCYRHESVLYIGWKCNVSKLWEGFLATAIGFDYLVFNYIHSRDDWPPQRPLRAESTYFLASFALPKCKTPLLPHFGCAVTISVCNYWINEQRKLPNIKISK